MMKATFWISALVAALVMCAGHAWGAEPGTAVIQVTQKTADEMGPSLRREARAALSRGAKWLAARQNGGGWWSNRDFPALTALPLWALVQANARRPETMEKAVAFILSCAREDGSIYVDVKGRKGGGMANYNTALCMVALHAVGDPGLIPTVQKARAFVARTQHMGDDMYRGGMGYDEATGRPYTDLSNSFIAYEAMRLTRNVEDLKESSAEQVDLNWAAARTFLEGLQHRKASNTRSWVSAEPKEQGGFIYRPDLSHAGAGEDVDGKMTFRAYGSMTYAGLLAFIYAKVSVHDPRVQSAFDWTRRHWSLDENPGMGQEGLYYFYTTLAKALNAYGENPIVLTDGRRVNWRQALVRKLVGLQKIDPKAGDGYWINESGRWWEADPVLVTSYSMLALASAVGGR